MIHIAKYVKCDAKDNKVPQFEYIPDPYERYYGRLGKYYSIFANSGYDDDDETVTHYPLQFKPLQYQCAKCNKFYDETDVFAVKAKDRQGMRNYCIDCVSTGVNWCKKCGEPFEVVNDTDELCQDCARGQNGTKV